MRKPTFDDLLEIIEKNQSQYYIVEDDETLIDSCKNVNTYEIILKEKEEDIYWRITYDSMYYEGILSDDEGGIICVEQVKPTQVLVTKYYTVK